MRGLQGDLGTMSLKELVVHLAEREASGKLSFAWGERVKEVTLEGGDVVNARSNLSREYFGQFLINIGLITADQLDKAYETQRETRIYIGKILTMIGVVTEEQVASALALKFRETLLSAFAWTEGEFTFIPDEAGADLEGVETRVALGEILTEASFRETAWQAIRSAFPSGDLRLSLHPEKLAVPVRPGSVDARITEMIQDGLTLDEMALGLHATDFFFYQRLYALYRLEAVSVRPPVDALSFPSSESSAGSALPRIPGLEPSAEELAGTARSLLDQGNPREAAAVATRAVERSPLPEHQALLRKAETQWLTLLRRELLHHELVPILQIPAEDVAQLALTSAQRYLLSRVDGVRTLRTIVQSSPVPELEALRAFRDFADGRLLALVARAA